MSDKRFVETYSHYCGHSDRCKLSAGFIFNDLRMRTYRSDRSKWKTGNNSGK